MTYSEDPASPAPPFSGDGSIFDQPDVLLQSPTTNERVVDTQSGFLVVVKRMGERLALSFKRRVGTPPSSNVLLTSDESLKLSKILANSIVGLDDVRESPATGAILGGRRRFPFTDLGAIKSSGGARKVAGKPLLITGGAVVLALALMLSSYVIGRQAAPKASVIAADSDQLSAGKIDKFARIFVSDMLDFNPSTYKISQVQAMSYMSAELLEKYWKETNFPLTRKQLKSLPQGTTVMINKIAEEKLTDAGSITASVDIFADLVRTETKISSPVHIKLKLGLNEDGGIRVLEQEDLTAALRG